MIYLIPVDFSPCSLQALRYAAEWGAAEGGVKLVLFHAYLPPTLEPYMESYMQTALLAQQEELALQHFAEMKDTLPADLQAKHEWEFRLALGPPVEEIRQQVESWQPDLLVMGMRGSNKLLQKWLGSTTTGVMQRIAIPLLVVPEGTKFEPVRRLVYASDYEAEDVEVIDRLLDFAQRRQAHIHCVHVQTQEKAEAETRMREQWLKQAYAFEMQRSHLQFDSLSHEEVGEGLRQYLSQHHAQLLVMLTHRRGWLGSWLMGSETKKMAQRSPVPLWIFHME
jgi:nucleotide-binding universal stress UspA family protein